MFSLPGFETMTMNLTEQTPLSPAAGETTLDDQSFLFVGVLQAGDW